MTLADALTTLGGTLIAVQCCRGYHVEGVRPNGDTRCVRAPEKEDVGCYHRLPCDLSSAPDEPWYPVSIRCTGGSEPIVIDARTVGCQARH